MNKIKKDAHSFLGWAKNYSINFLSFREFGLVNGISTFVGAC